MEKVQQHRQIYPLPFEQICKLSSFEQILGRKKATIQRKKGKHVGIKLWIYQAENELKNIT